ncbi:MAG: GNAT family N-acetyltransferase, partial [Pseudomonadota bacterium]
ASVGWPHTHKDWDMLQRLSHGRVARTRGQTVGTALRTDFGPALSTLNMILVAQRMRGQGVARALIAALMEGQDGRAYRLISTPAGRPLYAKMGFAEVGGIVHMQGCPSTLAPSGRAVLASAADRSAILAQDACAVGGDRSRLLDALMTSATFAVHAEHGQVDGFACLRAFGAGYVIGPVSAPDAEAGKALICFLAARVPGQILRLDVTEESGLAPWLAEIGLAEVTRAPILHRGDAVMSRNLLAICNQAFG